MKLSVAGYLYRLWPTFLALRRQCVWRWAGQLRQSRGRHVVHFNNNNNNSSSSSSNCSNKCSHAWMHSARLPRLLPVLDRSTNLTLEWRHRWRHSRCARHHPFVCSSLVPNETRLLQWYSITYCLFNGFDAF